MRFDYIINEDNTITLTKIIKPEALIKIPETVDNYIVSRLGNNIVKPGEKSIPREIILPQTLKTIESYGFNDMRYLRKLVFPESLREISEFGIFTCPDLTELYIPSSVVTLGHCAFGYMYEHARAYKLNYFTLLCEKESAAEKFALDNGIEYRNVGMSDY